MALNMFLVMLKVDWKKLQQIPALLLYHSLLAEKNVDVLLQEPVSFLPSYVLHLKVY